MRLAGRCWTLGLELGLDLPKQQCLGVSKVRRGINIWGQQRQKDRETKRQRDKKTERQFTVSIFSFSCILLLTTEGISRGGCWRRFDFGKTWCARQKGGKLRLAALSSVPCPCGVVSRPVMSLRLSLLFLFWAHHPTLQNQNDSQCIPIRPRPRQYGNQIGI